MLLPKPPNYLYLSVAILWLYSGIVPVVFAPVSSLEMLMQLGVATAYRWPLFIAAAILDVTLGLLILTRLSKHAWLWLLQFVVVAGYSIIVGVALPENWIHPFAPLIKNIPIMALLFYLYQVHLFNY